ncbi:MAG: type II toxin-antitoxin system RelE/ParE family toxin [Terriglobales bacterium]
MEAFPRELRPYETVDGRVPFSEFMDTLEGQEIYEFIMVRLDHVERGTLGDTNPVGNGVSELVMDDGPGYRIYYGQLGKHGEIVVLLNGGLKKTQQVDIKLAKQHWEDFNNAEED